MENEKKYIRKMAFQFFLSGEVLYKRTHDATLLRIALCRCWRSQSIDRRDARRVDGSPCKWPFLAKKIMRAGYYWLTMENNCIKYVQACHKCKIYQNHKNAPPQYLHTLATPWPFFAWGINVIEAITRNLQMDMSSYWWPSTTSLNGLKHVHSRMLPRQQ